MIDACLANGSQCAIGFATGFGAAVVGLLVLAYMLGLFDYQLDERGYKIVRTRLVRRGYAMALLQRIYIHPLSPEYLIPHERVHVDQQRRDGWRWYWRYKTSREARFEYEVPAHRAAVLAGEPIAQAASELTNNYGLDITYEAALLRLSQA